jgi:cytochrome c peroxidase
MTLLQYLPVGILLLGVLGVALGSSLGDQRWSADEQGLIEQLSLAALGPVPSDPSNHVADDPPAVELDRAVFSDTRFSADCTVACATCCPPARQFQGDLPLGRGMGTTGRRPMPTAGMAHNPLLFWNGRKDSLWSQTLGPLESGVEHGDDLPQYAHLIAQS